jgi:hypothetical protein
MLVFESRESSHCTKAVFASQRSWSLCRSPPYLPRSPFLQKEATTDNSTDMDTIPLEILEQILLDVVEYTHPNTERLRTLTAASKRGILGARTVWGNYRHHDPLRRLFLEVLKEVPFTSYDIGAGNVSLLQALSESEFASDVTTISFCALSYDQHSKRFRHPYSSLSTLSRIISRFPLLKHVRYYALPPACAQGEWKPPHRFERAFFPIVEPTPTPEHQTGLEFASLQWCFQDGRLETFTMPYCGNVASYCAIPCSYMFWRYQSFATSLRRISVNLAIHRNEAPIFDTWVFRCPNLEFLEIALCRMPSPELDRDRHNVQQFWLPYDERHSFVHDPPTKLREVRLLTDTDVLVDTISLLQALKEFKGLKKLCLAHLMLEGATWCDFFQDLRGKKSLDLDVLWLLNPADRHPWRERVWTRYDLNPKIVEVMTLGAAREVRIVHRPFPWGGGNKSVDVGDGRGYRYEGFEVFEVFEETNEEGTVASSSSV